MVTMQQAKDILRDVEWDCPNEEEELIAKGSWFYGWIPLDLPTGIFPVKKDGDDILVMHTMFLEHGRRWTAQHDPKKLKLVGGSMPF